MTKAPSRVGAGLDCRGDGLIFAVWRWSSSACRWSWSEGRRSRLSGGDLGEGMADPTTVVLFAASVVMRACRARLLTARGSPRLVWWMRAVASLLNQGHRHHRCVFQRARPEWVRCATGDQHGHGRRVPQERPCPRARPAGSDRHRSVPRRQARHRRPGRAAPSDLKSFPATAWPGRGEEVQGRPLVAA